MKKDDVRDSILSAQNAQGEAVYLFRRKGLDDFVTCSRERFDELSNKPALFETRILYTHAERARVPELDAEDWKVLQRLRNALPDVGLNGWHRGVTVLSKILSAAPSAPEGGEVGL